MVLDKNNLTPIGHIIGETTHSKIVYTATRPPRVGEYVLVEYPPSPMGDLVLGIVEKSVIGNPSLMIQGITPKYVEKAEKLNLDRNTYMIGYARLLGWLKPLADDRILRTPKYPPKPGARVYEAGAEVLKAVFERSVEDGWIRIGELVNHPGVPVYVNASSIVSRHLAVLAVTGAGKSNTVGVLVDRIVNQLGGTVLIVDMHNEYLQIAGKDNTRIVKPMLNPVLLTTQEYYNLLRLEPKASKQRMYLRRAIRRLHQEKVHENEPDKFLDRLEEKLKMFMEKHSRDSASIADLLNKLGELRERYEGTLLSVEAKLKLEDVVEPGMANILKLGEVDEEAADVVVSHTLRWLLSERKKYIMTGGKQGYPVPVLTVIEEAHVLIPRNRSTLTKSVAARIAREGRKFGLGLALVSQRPKNIDEDALSQTNNKIILKLVEPNDKRYVQNASETLSEELMEMLSDLNTGEAILLGMMTPIPALVKIDKAENKTTGSDINVHEEWRKYRESRRKEEEREEVDPYELMK